MLCEFYLNKKNEEDPFGCYVRTDKLGEDIDQ